MPQIQKIYSGRAFPYFRAVNMPVLRTKFSCDTVRIKLNTISDSTYKGPQKLITVLDNYGIDTSHYFIGKNVISYVNEPKLVDELEKNQENGISFDENANNANAVFGGALLMTYFDVIDNIIYFSLFDKSYDEFNTREYLKYCLRATSETINILAAYNKKIKDPLGKIYDELKSDVTSFGNLIQFIRNPFINAKDLAINDPLNLLGISSLQNIDIQKRFQIAKSLWHNIFNMHNNYCKLFYDIVEPDELKAAMEYASTALKMLEENIR